MRQRANSLHRPAGAPYETAFKATLGSLCCPAALMDGSSVIMEANQPLSGLLGEDAEAMAGKPLDTFLEGLPGKATEARLLSGPFSSAAVRYSISELPGGERLLTLGSAVEEAAGLRTELARREAYIEAFRTGVLRMLTDLDRSESELQAACQKLSDARLKLMHTGKMTALGELAASIAHEVAQPLTVIRGLSQKMLRSVADSSEDHARAALIFDASARMEEIIRHLKAFSRAEPPLFEPVDLNRSVADSFLMLGELLRLNSIESELDLGPVPIVSGSACRLEQVIINLVTNARDALNGPGRIRVSTGTLIEGGRRLARLTVSDTGPGIPPENRERIFDAFFTTKGPGQGTGLGLSISLGIVREHGGEIRVENAPGAGSSFHVVIPERAPKGPAVEHADRNVVKRA